MNSNGLLQVEGDVPEELAQEEEDQDHDAVAQLGGWIVQVLQQVLQEEGLQANRNIVNRYCGYLQGGPKKSVLAKNNRFSLITQPRMHQF